MVHTHPCDDGTFVDLLGHFRDDASFFGATRRCCGMRQPPEMTRNVTAKIVVIVFSWEVMAR